MQFRPLLPSCWGFSVSLGHGVFFFFFLWSDPTFSCQSLFIDNIVYVVHWQQSICWQYLWEIPAGPVVRSLRIHCRGPGFRPLVRELRSCEPPFSPWAVPTLSGIHPSLGPHLLPRVLPWAGWKQTHTHHFPWDPPLPWPPPWELHYLQLLGTRDKSVRFPNAP